MLYDGLVTRLIGLMESPERQTGEKDEGGPDAVVPMGLVYLNFHRSEVFGDIGIVKVVHLVDHPDSGVNDRVGTEGTSTFTQTESET